MRDETVEIRCLLVKEGDYQNTLYFIRYFQPDGKGELRLDDGRTLTPNDLFPLKRDVFRLYYTSRCSDGQTVDLYVEDSFGQALSTRVFIPPVPRFHSEKSAFSALKAGIF